MSKVLIVSMLQIVLAQNIRNARPYVRTNIDTERQFYFRNPDSTNLEVRGQDSESKTDNLDTYRPHSRPNEEHLSGHRQPYQPLIGEGSGMINNGYPLTNGPESHYFNEGTGFRGEPHASSKASNSDRKHYRIIVNRRKTQFRSGDYKDTLDSNLNTHGVNSDSATTEHNTRDYSQQTTLDQVRTNENSTDVSKLTTIELTTVPVILLMSVTLKTNPNVQSRFANAETANDSRVEISNNNDDVTFVDNPKNDTADKTAIDNDVRFNKNMKHEQSEEDKWVWGTDTPVNATTSSEKTVLAGDLDDRTSLIADGCPNGQAKVRGMCVPVHGK